MDEELDTAIRAGEFDNPLPNDDFSTSYNEQHQGEERSQQLPLPRTSFLSQPLLWRLPLRSGRIGTQNMKKTSNLSGKSTKQSCIYLQINTIIYPYFYS